MTTIDVHAHLWTDSYIDALTAAGVTGLEMYRHLGASDTAADLAERLRLMDAAGIDMQVLSATPLVPYSASVETAIAMSDHVNNEYARLVKAHFGRFRAFLSLPLPYVGAAVAALERLSEPAFVGVALTTDILGSPLSDEAFEPLFAALNERAATVLVHPVGENARSSLLENRPLRWSVGAPIEDTIAVADLIATGFLSRFPRVRIISTHLGGALAMLLPRMQAQQPWEAPHMPETPIDAARRLWFDTVTHVNSAALRAGSDVLGADRLVLGTDYPFQTGAELLADLAQYDDVLTPEQAVAVRASNAMRLFNVDTPRASPSFGTSAPRGVADGS